MSTWLLPALERAVKTFAQTILGLVVVDGIVDVASVQANWKTLLATAAVTTVLSLLTSAASAGFGPSGSPSLVPDPKAAVPAGEHRRVAREDVRSAITDEPGDHGHVRPTKTLRPPRKDGP